MQFHFSSGKYEYIINDEKYLVCKEWFEPNRKYFDKWLIQIQRSKESSKETSLKLLAEYLKEEDRTNVSISRSNIFDSFGEIEWIKICIENMERRNILMAFQGNHQQLVVEDYDVLYKIINNPYMYIGLTEETGK